MKGSPQKGAKAARKLLQLKTIAAVEQGELGHKEAQKAQNSFVLFVAELPLQPKRKPEKPR